MRDIKFDHINLYTLLRDNLHSLPFILLAAVSAFIGVSAFYSYKYVPEYTSDMTVSVNTISQNGYSPSSLASTIKVSEILGDVFESSLLSSETAKKLGEPITGKITAEQISETNLIKISVTDKSPMSAYKTLNTAYSCYSEITPDTFQDIYINVLSSPAVPQAPSDTVNSRQSEILASLAAAALSLSAVSIISYMRDTVKSPSDFERCLIPNIMGTVYYEKPLRGAHGKSAYPNISAPLSSRYLRECFTALAVKIIYLNKTEGCKTFMITSTGEHEGKTTAAVNSAISLSAAGLRVLLIDADLRRPCVRKYFSDRGEECELSDLINHKKCLTQVLCFDSATKVYCIGNRHSVTNSAELLASSTFTELLEALKKQFDVIIIDTPPISLVADAETAASNVDAAMLVVRQDTSRIPQINDACEILKSSGAYICGCIFNCVNRPFRKKYYRSGKYSYGEYSYGGKQNVH